jgi:hypothetical protein
MSMTLTGSYRPASTNFAIAINYSTFQLFAWQGNRMSIVE